MTTSRYRVGIDIGGTFTDFCIHDTQTGQVTTHKIPSTPADPSIAVIQGLEHLHAELPDFDHLEVIHGSTVATNAMLERRGVRTALITTAGFADVITIGRQNRSDLYALRLAPKVPIIPESDIYELDERIGPHGSILKPLASAEISRVVDQIVAGAYSSVAICLLFSFANPAHELAIAAPLRARGLHVSCSCEVHPEFREFERTSTTLINAYVSPILAVYLDRLKALPMVERITFMQSNGGMISLDEASRFGVRSILSGPAGGVAGARHIYDKLFQNWMKDNQLTHLAAFDMGGTSTDVALIGATDYFRQDASIDGWPIGLPMLDIHTIGAGGGSIVAIDAGGALNVGPQSAGSDPGPACYGKGQHFTVTDANLLLGRIPGNALLAGTMQLNPALARQAAQILMNKVDLAEIDFCIGVIDIVNAHMDRALRKITVERGIDPRTNALLCYGGAGGLHACSLARSLGMPWVLLPLTASVFSAFGMLAAQLVAEVSKTVMFTLEQAYEKLDDEFRELESLARNSPSFRDLEPSSILLTRSLDLRYVGQSYELRVVIDNVDGLLEQFTNKHIMEYGYAHTKTSVEVVTARVHIMQLSSSKHAYTQSPGTIADIHNAEHSPVRVVDLAVVHTVGVITGPAVIQLEATSLLLGNGDEASMLDNSLIAVRIALPGADND